MPVSIGSGWRIGGGWSMGSGGAAPPPPPAVTDPYFMYNSLLLTGDGTNLAQNNTFLDSSTNNFAVTRAGNTTQGTFSPYGANWSNYFGASTSNRISAPANAAFAFGTGAFTVEAWIYVTNLAAENFVFDTRSSVSTAGVGFSIEPNTGKLRYSGNANNVLTTTAITANTWNHVAWVYNGTTLTGYINGVSGGTVTPGFNITQNNGQIGNVPFSGVATTAYLSNVRVVKGTAVYASAFTPPTSPLTAIAGTSLLTCQSNRFVDNSSNAFALTVSGTPTVQVFSPFEPSAAYSTSTIGGSGYFDGAGDFLTAPANTAFNLGTGDFTIECWVYLTNSTATTQSIMGIGDTGTTNDIQLWYNNVANKITFNVYGNPRFDSSSTVTTGNWIHLACTRASGTFKLFINGAQEATGSLGNNLSNNVLVIGRPYASLPNNEYFYGYISNLRIVKGTAVYTSAFTPPTTPVTAISGTSILTNFTNAGIIDNAMMNNLETVGNAQISTTQSKFGGSSMSFDGTGDYLNIPGNAIFNVSSGDFTIEYWKYHVNNSAYQTDFYTGNGGTISLAVGIDNTLHPYIQGSSGQVNSSVTITAGTWNHIAWVKSGSTITGYLNGVSMGSSFAVTIGSNTTTVIIGYFPGYGQYTNGYIDDLRITKGYARYTTNFTPPTAALPTY